MSDHELIAVPAKYYELRNRDWLLHHVKEFSDLPAGGFRLFLQQMEQPDFLIWGSDRCFADIPVPSKFVDDHRHFGVDPVRTCIENFSDIIFGPSVGVYGSQHFFKGSIISDARLKSMK